MAVVQKPQYFTYRAKANATGLTDVKAQIYLNGVAKAVGSNAVVLTEVDSTNSPGLYLLSLSASVLTGYGVGATTINDLEIYINSASHPAPDQIRQDLNVASTDDLNAVLGIPATTSIAGDIAAVQTKLGAPTTGTVSGDIAAVKSDTAAIKADLETGTASLANILSNIQTLQNASIGNGVGYVIPSMLIPASGSNTYRIPITINNNDGSLIDPTSNLITIGLLNSSGTDRSSFLTGATGSPGSAPAVRDSTGQYHIIVTIPSTEIEEDLLFSFAYTIGSNAMVRYGQTQITTDLGAAGFALQSTLLNVQTTVNAIKSDVENATYGLAAIDSILTNAGYGNAAIAALLNSGTYGLAALQALINALQTTENSNNALLTNGTYGLSALQAGQATIEGSGFVGTTDSLHAISAFLQANLYYGGKAV